MLVSVLILWIIFLQQADGCGLGQTVLGITASKAKGLVVTCSVRSIPICPDYCLWTNSRSCGEAADKYKVLNKTRLMVNNITYSYWKKDKRQMIKPSKENELNQTSKEPLVRCCTGTHMEVSQCQKVTWKVNNSKEHDDFNVAKYAQKNCKMTSAIIKDFKPLNAQRQEYSIEICCLNYSKDYSQQVVCRSPKKPGDVLEAATDVALGVSLPLALAIGLLPTRLLPTPCVQVTEIQGYIDFNEEITIRVSGRSECSSVCMNYNPTPNFCFLHLHGGPTYRCVVALTGTYDDPWYDLDPTDSEHFIYLPKKTCY